MYLNSLASDDHHDDVVFRFVSLWFDQSHNNHLNTQLKDKIASVPTHKFVRVVHQLTARLSHEKDSKFQTVLAKLVTGMCIDHPFHSLPHILLLRHGVPSKLNPTTDDGSRSRRTSQRHNVSHNLNKSQLSRANAAESVLKSVHNHANRRVTVDELLHVFEAYIEWATHDVKRDTSIVRIQGQRVMPQRLKLSSIKNLDIPVSTHDLPIDKTCAYDSDKMVCIQSYKKEFKLAGGIHTPKIMYCLGTDGRQYQQLVSTSSTIT